MLGGEDCDCLVDFGTFDEVKWGVCLESGVFISVFIVEFSEVDLFFEDLDLEFLLEWGRF